MFPLYDSPTIVKESLPYFGDMLSKPQQKHFAEYAAGLYTCDNHTVQGINDIFIGHGDQSALNRFLTGSKRLEEKLDGRRIQIALKKRGDVDSKHSFLLIDIIH